MNNLACNDSQVVPVVIQPVQSVRSELLSGYPDLLKVNHIAEITGLSEQTIRRQMKNGSIPSRKVGRQLYCSKRKFIEYIEGEVKNER